MFYSEGHYAECLCANYYSDEHIILINVGLLCVILMSVTLLSYILLKYTKLSVIHFITALPNVMLPCVILLLAVRLIATLPNVIRLNVTTSKWQRRTTSKRPFL